jgi:hypothetical protein
LWSRSRITASALSRLTRITPSCPLPELSTRHPCSRRRAPCRFRFSVPSYLSHPAPPSRSGPEADPSAGRVAHTKQIVSRSAVRGITPVRTSVSLVQPLDRIAACQSHFPSGKSSMARARISPHARAPQCRGVFAPGMSPV